MSQTATSPAASPPPDSPRPQPAPARPPVDPNKDAWRWRVHYSDGGTFDEFSQDPGDRATGTDDCWQDHGWAEVDQTRLAAVELIPNRPELPHHFVLIDTPGGRRAIFFRRRLPVAYGDTLMELGRLSGTVLGWQRTVEGHNVASFVCYLDNGSCFITDDRETLNARLNLLASLAFTPLDPGEVGPDEALAEPA